MSQANLRHVPAVEKLLQALGTVEGLPRALVLAEVRAGVARMKEDILAGAEPAEFPEVVRGMRARLEQLARTRLQPVINGTGVILHTNLGRAPLGPGVAGFLHGMAEGYSNLELDLDSGERGRRGAFLERGLALLCEAEAATVVNNCAAALVLVLRLLARGRKNEVIISRSELVEIGGGFRIPDILETSGAKLREVGATNKTTLADYEAAIGPKTGLILKVHRSNFFIEGFTDWPSTPDLAALAGKHGLPFVEDLGSGAMVATEALNTLEHEPTAAEVLRGGVDLVCVSGDKLLGGPQAGVIAGRADLVARLKKEPFFRALRCDKLVLGALQETVAEYLDGTPHVPALAMLRATTAELAARAERLLSLLPEECRSAVSAGTGTSRCGGGTMPKSALASVTLDFTPARGTLEALAARFRLGAVPVVGFIEGGVYKLDLRTVLPHQDEALARAITAVLTK